ncbi:MAG: hypothetical protein RLN90_09680 [Balneolaceae bacterium]
MSTKEAKIELIDIAKEKGIIPGIQMAIAGYVTGVYEPFAELTDPQANKVFIQIEKMGFEKLQKIALQDQQPEEFRTEKTGTATSLEVAEIEQPGNALVLDDETGGFVEVTPEMKQAAFQIHNMIEHDSLRKGFMMKYFSDHKLYTAWGCTNFREYAETVSTLGLSACNRYLKIGNAYAPLFPEIDFSVDSNPHALLPPEAENRLNEYSELGYSKLYELTKVPDEEFVELFKKGTAEVNGKTFDLELIKEQSTRQALQEVRAIKKDYSRKLSLAEEDKKKAVAERDHFKKELEKNQKLIDRAYELEAQYGKEASRIAEVEALLDRSSNATRELEKWFGRVDIEEEDPESLQEQARSVLRRINTIQYVAKQRFKWFDELAEMPVLPAEIPIEEEDENT